MTALWRDSSLLWGIWRWGGWRWCGNTPNYPSPFFSSFSPVHQSQSPFAEQRLPWANSAVLWQQSFDWMRPLTEWQLTSVKPATVHYGAGGSCSVWQANAGLVKPKQPRNDLANKSTWDRPWGLKETNVFQGSGLWSHDLCVRGSLGMLCWVVNQWLMCTRDIL